MDIGGVSPAERSNVLGQSTKVIQDAYNQARPGGIFATPTPAARLHSLLLYLKTSPFKPVLMERQHLHFLIEMLQQQVALRQDPQE
jgi:hypothetical protein